MARHYGPALDDNLSRHPKAMEKEFEPIWSGEVITTTKERHPGKSIAAVVLPVERGCVAL